MLMAREDIPDDVRRFILTSIASVPYLEALLLARDVPERDWEAKSLAQRLYIGEPAAAELLTTMHAANLLTRLDGETPLYRYHPESDALREIVDRVAMSYARNLIDVTNLIHSNSGRKAQQFADAFKWRKDS
ncbi:MAG: hypothetical protein ACTHL1_03315 [Burkholderiaceae bacterium]